MGTSTWGSNPAGWSAWVNSGANTYNVIHQGSSWTAPTVGRFISHSAYFAGDTGGCQAQMNVWRGDNLAFLMGSVGLGVAQGSETSGGQAWQSAASSGTTWIGGPFLNYFQFGWGRDPAATHVFSTYSDGGTYWGDTNTGGYTVSSIAGSTQAPMGFNGSVGATATMQNLQIYVRRGGAWNLALTRTLRGGAWGYYPIYVKRGGTWVPVQRLDGPGVQVRRATGWKRTWDAMQDRTDPFFYLGAGGDLNVEDRFGRIMIDGDWCPMALRLRHDDVTELGTDRREWDRRMAAVRKLVRAA